MSVMHKIAPGVVIAAFESKDYKNVIALYERADRPMREHPKFMVIRAHAYYELRKYRRAIQVYNCLLRKRLSREMRADVYYNRGLALRELDRFAEALRDFRRSGAQYEKCESLIGEMLYILSKRNPRYRLALRYLTSWLGKHPDDEYSRFLIGACYHQLDRYKLAAKVFLKCLKNGFVNRELIRGLVLDLSIEGDIDKIKSYVANLLDASNDPDGVFRDTLEKEWKKLKMNSKNKR